MASFDPAILKSDNGQKHYVYCCTDKPGFSEDQRLRLETLGDAAVLLRKRGAPFLCIYYYCSGWKKNATMEKRQSLR